MSAAALTYSEAQPKQTLFNAILALSVLAHVMVIVVLRFAPPDPRTLFNHAPLDIVLVNAKSQKAPSKPDVLAQANLNGGGNTDLNRRIKTPLPSIPTDSSSQDLERAAKRQNAAEVQQAHLLSALRSSKSIDSQEAKPRPQQTQGLDLDSLRQQASDIARLEGEIAREMDALQKRPRMATVGARAKSALEARYVDDWRSKIERIGNLNYPTGPRGERIYGRLLVLVEINQDGSLRNVSFDRRPGYSTDSNLEAAAARIVRMAAPFPALPSGITDEVGKRADILSIHRTWTFSRGDNAMN